MLKYSKIMASPIKKYMEAEGREKNLPYSTFPWPTAVNKISEIAILHVY